MNGKKQMSIGTKITLGFVGLSLISIVVGAFGLFNMNQLSDDDDSLYQGDMEGITLIQQANIALLEAVDAEKNYLLASTQTQRTQYLETVKTARARYEKNVGAVRPLLDTDEEKALFQKLETAYVAWAADDDEALAQSAKEALKQNSRAFELSTGDEHARYDTIAKIIGDIGSLQQNSAKELVDHGNQVFAESAMVTIVIIAVGFLAGILMGFLISRSISKPVTTFVRDLSEASSQIGISSGQLSQASQEIANGATEQASQVEETSASMEELASMVKQNVENAKQASLLAGRSTESSRSGSQEMSLMVGAMEGISRSAEEIRNVIDVIEDIAFQTNMLALNAAVEAARAGEAGLGFAVVADEVKNLANRSAASAKETATMIKETTAKIGEGMEISRRLSVVFQEILNDSQKVGEVTREVEIASQQQEEGIDQVNQAIVQFDSVVQNNASSSEETASAAEELQSQVQTLEGVIQQLYRLVTGREHAKAAVAEHRLPPPRPAARDGSERRNGHQQKISFETDEELVRS